MIAKMKKLTFLVYYKEYEQKLDIGAKYFILKDILRDIEVVNGLDQTDASDLEQIINIFISSGKTLDDTEDKTEIAFDVFFSCLHIPCQDPFK